MLLPGPGLLPMLPPDAPPKHVPFCEGTTPEEETPRVSRERRGARAPRTPREKGAESTPPSEEHPADEPTEFRLPARKISRRTDISCGLNSGQAIVKEGVERPVIKSRIYICTT